MSSKPHASSTPIIDGHTYCFPPLDSPAGLPLEEKMRRIQQELGTHHTFTMRVSDRTRVDNSSLIDPESGEFQTVRWKRDHLNRLSWEYRGETYLKGNLPPLLSNAEYQPEQLVAAMDYAQVDLSILHTYPTFGVMSRMHRQAVRRFPDRLRRLLPLPFDSQNPAQFAERVEDEIDYGGVCGLQFFTGWHQSRFAGSWDDPQMSSYWNFVVSLGLPIYFTLALGHSSQFMETGKAYFLKELERLGRWMERFPEAVVVVTHGLPWRDYVEHNRIALPEAVWEVFQRPSCYLQLLLPLRIGDIWDFPYKEVEPTIHQCIERIGIDRLIWGTDMPMLERFCTYGQAIRHISHHTSGLTQEDVAKLLGGNVRALLDVSDPISPLQPSPVLATGLSTLEWTSCRQAPAIVGDDVATVRTPALLVDVDALKHNLRAMNAVLKEHPHVHVRPHAKTHKCSELAMLQAQEHKSARVCCQKVSEAEAMFEGGIFDVLITNEVVDQAKLGTLAELVLRGARISICVDQEEHVRLLDEVMLDRGVRLTVLCELDVGGGRGGVATIEELLALALQVNEARSLAFGGIQAYQGAAQHMRTHEERRAAVAEARRKLVRARSTLEEHDLAVNVITGGGTGTFELEAASGVYNEVQPGSYVFHDADYARNLDAEGQPVSRWRQSLFVLATVISNHGRAGEPGSMIDVGLKSVSFDSGPPLVHGHPDVELVNLGDEHSFLRGHVLPVGTRVRLVPGHCDPTVNLYPYLVVTRADRVHHVWAVDGRGPGI
jgi:3-hydroxy-D-aspartate aldolase